MSLKDEFRKFIHPYDEEDEPEEYQEESARSVPAGTRSAAATTAAARW